MTLNVEYLRAKLNYAPAALDSCCRYDLPAVLMYGVFMSESATREWKKKDSIPLEIYPFNRSCPLQYSMYDMRRRFFPPHQSSVCPLATLLVSPKVWLQSAASAIHTFTN